MRKAGHGNEDIYVCVCNFGFASTVLIKQHVVIDIIGGVLVVEIGLFLAKKLNTKEFFMLLRIN